LKDFFRSLSKKALAILLAVTILVLIAVPTALMSGLFSGVFESPSEGIRVFFIMVGAGVLFLVVELLVENWRDNKKKKNSSAQK